MTLTYEILNMDDTAYILAHLSKSGDRWALALKLRREGKILREIAPILGLKSVESARRLVYFGKRMEELLKSKK
jgi:hypothetical protein